MYPIEAFAATSLSAYRTQGLDSRTPAAAGSPLTLHFVSGQHGLHYMLDPGFLSRINHASFTGDKSFGVYLQLAGGYTWAADFTQTKFSQRLDYRLMRALQIPDSYTNGYINSTRYPSVTAGGGVDGRLTRISDTLVHIDLESEVDSAVDDTEFHEPSSVFLSTLSSSLEMVYLDGAAVTFSAAHSNGPWCAHFNGVGGELWAAGTYTAWAHTHTVDGTSQNLGTYLGDHYQLLIGGFGYYEFPDPPSTPSNSCEDQTITVSGTPASASARLIVALGFNNAVDWTTGTGVTAEEAAAGIASRLVAAKAGGNQSLVNQTISVDGSVVTITPTAGFPAYLNLTALGGWVMTAGSDDSERFDRFSDFERSAGTFTIRDEAGNATATVTASDVLPWPRVRYEEPATIQSVDATSRTWTVTIGADSVTTPAIASTDPDVHAAAIVAACEGSSASAFTDLTWTTDSDTYASVWAQSDDESYSTTIHMETSVVGGSNFTNFSGVNAAWRDRQVGSTRKFHELVSASVLFAADDFPHNLSFGTPYFYRDNNSGPTHFWLDFSGGPWRAANPYS